MNEHELKRLLEAATSDSPALPPVDDEAGEAAALRSAWRRFATELTAADEQLNSDSGEFLSRLEQAVCDANSPATDFANDPAAASVNRPTMVAGNSPAAHPLHWKRWLALAACVAICGSAILWYGAGAESNTQPQTAMAEAEANSDSEEIAASQPPAVVIDSDFAASEPTSASDEAIASFDEAWIDPVDEEIAAASWQLAALQDAPRWDRSLEALQQYRDSVEQEMNELDL